MDPLRGSTTTPIGIEIDSILTQINTLAHSKFLGWLDAF